MEETWKRGIKPIGSFAKVSIMSVSFLLTQGKKNTFARVHAEGILFAQN